MATSSPYLTTAEVAAHLRCSPRTVRSLIARGKLRAVALTGTKRTRWRVRRDALAEFERRAVA
jgi:excisionase family DNA binding protein